jgi:hypothetical protein
MRMVREEKAAHGRGVARFVGRGGVGSAGELADGDGDLAAE